MRYVLIVCYDFPRISAAGVIRTYQFAKSLPDFGWQPVILTAQVPGENQEENIEISDGKLSCPKITAAPSKLTVPIRVDHREARALDEPSRVKGNGYMTGFARFAVPDGKIGWLVPAVKRGSQIARDLPIEACLSVSPRPTAHLVAYRLARRLNIPWVADFTLPWSDAYWLTGRPHLIESLDKKLEKLVVQSAQRVTVAYPEIGRNLGVRYGRAIADKITVLPTGFDEDLFTKHRTSAPAKFTVVYPGNHFCEEGRDGEYFLRAIDEWIELNPGLEEKAEFVFIGKRDESLFRHRRNMAHPEVIRVEPLTSHRACVQTVRLSHLCVVNTVGNRIPAKVYECMRAGKSILALTEPESDLARIVTHYPRGTVVAPQNTAAIRQALQDIWRRCSSGIVESMQTDGFVDRYIAKHSAELLAAIFNRLLKKDELIKVEA
jgi:glycosyltransferase involved in cell wall biosynthesis